MADAPAPTGPLLLGVPVLFLLFGATLVGVVVWHRRSLAVALGGAALILGVRVACSPFAVGAHLAEEWVKLGNLFGLLVGFSLLAEHFERSHLPALLPRLLPGGAKGCFALLVAVWLLSSLLDNIAAAMIGATVAAGLFRRRVHLGYLAAIVAAANAGGAGSVLGDTTTTMIWITGVSPLAVVPAYLGAAAALVVFGTCASLQQQRYAPLADVGDGPVPVDGARLAIVLVALAAMVTTNVVVGGIRGGWGDRFPFLAGALWLALLAGAPVRPPTWRLLPGAVRGGLFLLALVFSASLMPVTTLPAPSWQTTLGLGLLSSVFDNIPLTRMALDQGGYDWALLAYAVGFGGSILWFGSSAGVAVANLFPEARSVLKWLRAAWHVPLAFLIGFATQLALRGWAP